MNFKYNFDSIENERHAPDAFSPSAASRPAYRPPHILPRLEPHSKLQLRTALSHNLLCPLLINYSELIDELFSRLSARETTSDILLLFLSLYEF